MLCTVVLFTVLLASSTGQMLLWDSSAAIELVASLQRLYHARCVFLIASERSWMTVSPRVVHAQKMLSTQSVFSSLLGLQDLDRPQRFRTNRPLNVVFGNEENTLEYLRGLDRVPSHPRWVAFLDDDPSVALRGVNAEFDCTFLVVRAPLGARNGAQTGSISVAYRVERSAPLLVEHLADLTPERGLVVVSEDAGRRRLDLHGVQMRVCVRDYLPLVEAVRAAGSAIRFEGFLGDVWHVLEDELNFTSVYSMSQSEHSSSLLANDSWTGCMGAIQQRLADVSVGDLTMTIDRSRLVDHIYPGFTTNNRFYIAEPTAGNLSWNNFLAPFTARLWLAVVGSIVLMTLALLAAHRCAQRLDSEDPEDAMDVSLAFIYIFGLACGQGHDTTPQAASGRIIYQVAALSGIIVAASYGAALISFLTVDNKAFPVNSLEDLLLADGRYTLGIREDSGQLSLFETTADPLLRQIYTKLVQPQLTTLPRSDEEGLLRVCTDRSYGFMTIPEKTRGGGGKGLPCRIAPAPGIFIPARFAVAVAKGFPFYEALNSQMLRMRHSGTLRGLRWRYWPRTYPAPVSEFNSVSIEQATPIVAVVVGGVAVAVILLICERVVFGRSVERGSA